jgi:hypothetical protein
MASFMPEKKKIAEEEDKKTEVAVTAKKAPAPTKPREKTSALAPAAPFPHASGAESWKLNENAS